MYLQSILITGGNDQAHQQKLREIFSFLGFPHLPDFSNHPNIALVSPDEEKTAIGIDKVREIRSWLAIKSTTSQPKVAIISQADTLTEAAQNAFLKTLEEPPENTYLILLAKNTDFFLPTILSRCQIIELSETSELVLSEKENEDFTKVAIWIEKGSLPSGFAWAAENTDRKSALEVINKLIITARKLLLANSVSPKTVSRLFEAKKYLSANTNVRLTLENLFLN